MLSTLIRVELGPVQVGVRSTGREEILVGPSLDNATVDEHDNLLRSPHGRQAVGDDDGGPTLKGLVERPLDRCFAFTVEMGGRLIENEHARGLEQEPRECNALLLPA